MSIIQTFECEYRATCREELTKLLLADGCSKVEWKFPRELLWLRKIS